MSICHMSLPPKGPREISKYVTFPGFGPLFGQFLIDLPTRNRILEVQNWIIFRFLVILELQNMSICHMSLPPKGPREISKYATFPGFGPLFGQFLIDLPTTNRILELQNWIIFMVFRGDTVLSEAEGTQFWTLTPTFAGDRGDTILDSNVDVRRGLRGHNYRT